MAPRSADVQTYAHLDVLRHRRRKIGTRSSFVLDF